MRADEPERVVRLANEETDEKQAGGRCDGARCESRQCVGKGGGVILDEEKTRRSDIQRRRQVMKWRRSCDYTEATVK